jgi:hypothetical protein
VGGGAGIIYEGAIAMSLRIQVSGAFEFDESASLDRALQAVTQCVKKYHEQDGACLLSQNDLQCVGLVVEVRFQGAAPASHWESGEAVLLALARHAVRGEARLSERDSERVVKAQKPHTLARFLVLVEECDFEAIEQERDHVAPDHLDALVAAYVELTSWEQKAALVQLVQDCPDPRLRPMMLDVLCGAPDDIRGPLHWSKAVALSFLDGEPRHFQRYYRDNRLLKDSARRYLVR